jgi:hypothetical protein
MATTYEAIATVTVGSGGAANIEFTSIPGTYTDLLVKCSLRGDNGSTVSAIGFNSDTSTANYSQRRIYGNGSSVASDTNTNLGFISPIGNNSTDYTADTFSNMEIYIPNYASSNNKSVSVDAVTENNATLSYTTFTAGLWSQTTAISSIQINRVSGNYVQYSTATLYGIRNS